MRPLKCTCFPSNYTIRTAHSCHEYKNTEAITLFIHHTNLQQQSTAAVQGYTKMSVKLLTLMALLSLAALAAGFPTQNDRRDRTDMDALRLISKIAREQVFKQGSETADDESHVAQGMCTIKRTCTFFDNVPKR